MRTGDLRVRFCSRSFRLAMLWRAIVVVKRVGRYLVRRVEEKENSKCIIVRSATKSEVIFFARDA